MGKDKENVEDAKKPAIKAVNDILRGKDEGEALEIHGISKEAFDDILEEPEFIRHVRNRIGLSVIRARLLIAQYAQVATAKLISLTDCEKEETARKACLDVITLAQKQGEETVQKDKVAEIVESSPQVLDPETASKMLAVLAENDTE
ncbi:MAG: hypothetical protein ACYS6W_11185 [Planctomycetota bacterium]|jgi:hypothetical protein